MNALYPIIRRARRPLIIQDDDAGPPPAPPVPALVPLVAGTGVSYVKPPRQKEKRAGAAKGERKG